VCARRYGRTAQLPGERVVGEKLAAADPWSAIAETSQYSSAAAKRCSDVDCDGQSPCSRVVAGQKPREITVRRRWNRRDIDRQPDRCGRMIEKFLEIVTQLAGIGERFATALDWVDTGFFAGGVLDELPTGSRRRPRAPSPRCSADPLRRRGPHDPAALTA
jgi:hypothetical protein